METRKNDVLIYRPAKNAMQSGKANMKRWEMKFLTHQKLPTDSLMGWTSSPDTKRQIRLHFATLEDAVHYATRHGLNYQVKSDKAMKILPTSYAENFRYDRPEYLERPQ